MATNDRKSARLSIELRTLATKSAVIEMAESLAERVSVLERALVPLKNEVKGMLGAFGADLIEAISVTNVRCLEAKMAEAEAALGETERNTL